MIIQDWDWRYRVGFERSLRDLITRAIESLESDDHRAVMIDLFEWAASFVSLHALIVSASKQSVSEAEVEAIDSERLLRVPESVASDFERMLEEIPETLRLPCRALLDQAVSKSGRPPHRELFRITFGEVLPELLATPIPGATKVPGDREVARSRLAEFAQNWLRESQDDKRFSGGHLPSFVTTLADGPGFGEYWPVELCQSQDRQDNLMLFANSDSLREGNIRTTLAHEVFPGHGLFYAELRSGSPEFIDHGAMTLIEGWATWCEWHFKECDPFSRFSRDSQVRLLTYFDYYSGADDDLEQELLDQGFSGPRSRQLMIRYSQYPGLLFSYSLGGLWFERYLSPRVPLSFLRGLISSAAGDFFRIWSRSIDRGRSTPAT